MSAAIFQGDLGYSLARASSTRCAGAPTVGRWHRLALAGLILLPVLQPLMSDMASDPARAVANFHTLFNAVIALLFLPLLWPDRGLPSAADCRRTGYERPYTSS